MKRIIFKSAFAGILALSAVFNISCAQNSPTAKPTKAELIEELVDEFAEYGQFNGTVLVSDSSEVIFKKAYGLADMEWDIPNQTDTKFRLASVSKQFTAMLIVQLAAQNKIDLQVPISTYLPDFPNGDIITAHHLLTHTSGLPSYTNFPNYRAIMNTHYQPAKLVALFADSALVFQPGFRFDYSNSGYALLGYLAETITGSSYGELLQTQIFEPLGMVNSGYDSHRDIIKNRASGYYANGKEFVNASYIDMSVGYAAGGLYSTVEDLYLWDQALYTDKLMPQKYMDLLFEKHTTAGGTHYGYGWNIGIMYIGEANEIVKTIDHDGVINGFTSSIIRMPDSHSSVIFLNNTGGAPLNVMSKAIMAILTGNTYKRAKQSLAHATLDIIENEGLEKGLAFFDEHLYNEGYYLNEDELNLVGYTFVEAGQPEAAEAIFKRNVDAFPLSFNVYDSYGEALVLVGDTTAAIKNYQQSVKMNPDNENGWNVLKTLGVTYK